MTTPKIPAAPTGAKLAADPPCSPQSALSRHRVSFVFAFPHPPAAPPSLQRFIPLLHAEAYLLLALLLPTQREKLSSPPLSLLATALASSLHHISAERYVLLVLLSLNPCCPSIPNAVLTISFQLICPSALLTNPNLSPSSPSSSLSLNP